MDVAATSTRIRIIYAVCLGAGTVTHAATLWTCGLLCTYGGVPLITRTFWTSLTFLDPLAATLLFVRPRLGLASTLVIMLSDVANNTLIWTSHRSPGLAFNGVNQFAYACQLAFLIFVLSTVRLAWPERASS